jgi:hypothetical protein
MALDTPEVGSDDRMALDTPEVGSDDRMALDTPEVGSDGSGHTRGGIVWPWTHQR